MPECVLPETRVPSPKQSGRPVSPGPSGKIEVPSTPDLLLTRQVKVTSDPAATVDGLAEDAPILGGVGAMPPVTVNPGPTASVSLLASSAAMIWVDQLPLATTVG